MKEMSVPEIKMEKFDSIQELVKTLRLAEIESHKIGKQMQIDQDGLEELGIRCNSVTNCVEVGKRCFKCKNNYACRSYFRDLLQKDADVSVYANDASCFAAITEE